MQAVLERAPLSPARPAEGTITHHVALEFVAAALLRSLLVSRTMAARQTGMVLGPDVSRGDATRSAFVRPLTSLVGRAGDLDEIGRLLGSHRLVTLTGSGGCGKTRLAVEVASRLEASFVDGAAFADLAPIDAASLVPSAVAAAAGVSEAGAAPLPVLLVNALAERHLMLVVDNCEQVADACAELVHHLVRHCPGLVVLATSRVPLGVEGEMCWRVPSLGLPAVGAADPGAAVLGSDAGRLLVERARLVAPDVEWLPTEAEALATICRRLDGIPLALELAATRIRALGAVEVARGLEDRFRLLSSGPRTAPPRQRTLEASIDWSFELLNDAERLLLRRLAVFGAGFDIDSVEAVCTDARLDGSDVRPVLAELVDQSLVHVEHGAAAGARYRLLESVREYALVRLAESGEEPGLRDRHLDHLLDLTAAFASVVEGADLEEANRCIDPRVDDVRGGLEWSLGSGRVGDGLALAARLRPFWIFRNRNQEGRAWLTRLLDADQSGDLAGRVQALLAAAHLCLYASDPSNQARLASEALEAARELGDAALQARSMLFAGWANVFVDPPQALAMFTAGRDAATEAGSQRERENAAWGLGWVQATSGELAAARDTLREGILLARQRRSIGLRYGLTMLGYLDILKADLAQATAVLAEAASLFPGNTDRFNHDRVTTWQGVAAMYEGRYAEARDHLEAALASARQVGNPPMFAPLQLGLLDRALGDHAAARIQVEAARPALHELGFPWWFDVQALVCLGDAAAAAGDRAAADGFWREAMSGAEASGNPLARTVALLGLARGAVVDGDPENARRLTRDALRAAVRVGYRIGAIDALEALAVLHSDDSARLLAAVDAERSRTAYVRCPVDEPAYQAAVAVVGSDVDEPALGFDDAVTLALGGDARPVRPSSGWAALTPAEVRVARLVAEGLTNAEVGERLFISRRTVQAHLAHIYAKLEVANRAALAAAVSHHDRTVD